MGQIPIPKSARMRRTRFCLGAFCVKNCKNIFSEGGCWGRRDDRKRLMWKVKALNNLYFLSNFICEFDLVLDFFFLKILRAPIQNFRGLLINVVKCSLANPTRTQSDNTGVNGGDFLAQNILKLSMSYW